MNANRIDSLFSEGMSLMNRGMYKEAASCFEKARELTLKMNVR